MTFYFIVSSIAVVILIIALVGIGIAFNTPNNAEVFPTVPNKCPDYWTYDGSSCTIPTGTNAINAPTGEMTAGNTPGLSSTKIDFHDSGWSSGGTSTVCKQKQWADKYKVKWDGVTNYNNCL